MRRTRTYRNHAKMMDKWSLTVGSIAAPLKFKRWEN